MGWWWWWVKGKEGNQFLWMRADRFLSSYICVATEGFQEKPLFANIARRIKAGSFLVRLSLLLLCGQNPVGGVDINFFLLLSVLSTCKKSTYYLDLQHIFHDQQTSFQSVWLENLEANSFSTYKSTFTNCTAFLRDFTLESSFLYRRYYLRRWPPPSMSFYFQTAISFNG